MNSLSKPPWERKCNRIICRRAFGCLFFSHHPDKTTHLGRCLKGDAINTKNKKHSLQIISGIYCTICETEWGVRDRAGCRDRITSWTWGKWVIAGKKHKHSFIHLLSFCHQTINHDSPIRASSRCRSRSRWWCTGAQHGKMNRVQCWEAWCSNESGHTGLNFPTSPHYSWQWE